MSEEIIGQKLVALLTVFIGESDWSEGTPKLPFSKYAMAWAMVEEVCEDRTTIVELVLAAAGEDSIYLKRYADEHGWDPLELLRLNGLSFGG